VIEDEEMAMSQMEHFRDELQAAIERLMQQSGGSTASSGSSAS